MSVADRPFDSAWKIAKAPFYHSVNTDTSDPEVAEKLWALRDELMAEGISFDAGGGFPKGGRDWELDWSLSGATPDEVMIRMRDAGIPFTSTMRYVDELEPEAEARADQLNTYRDRKSDMEPVYQDAEGIGESKCPECGEMGMVIREPDGSLTLACGDCGFMEEYQGGDFDEGVSKQFDSQRAEMARMQQAEQPPYVGDDEDLNLNIGGNQGDCCQNLSARFEEIFSGTPFDNDNGFMEGFFESEESREAGAYTSGGITFEESQGAYHWWDLDCDNDIGPIEVFNELVKPELEWILENQPEMTPMVQGILNDALQAIQEYEACQRGGFGGVDFGGDFMASGDVFEDSWNIAKMKFNPFPPEAEPFLDAQDRMANQEQTPAEDEEVNVDLGNPNGIDPCCWAAFTDPRIEGWFFHDWSEVELESEYEASSDPPTTPCDWFRRFLEDMPRIFRNQIRDRERGPQGEIDAQTIEAVLADWDACSAKGFSGDFTASGDVFEDAWSVAKKERCWLCEKVKDTYGRYPNLPYYPPNWKRPCDCASDF